MNGDQEGPVYDGGEGDLRVGEGGMKDAECSFWKGAGGQRGVSIGLESLGRVWAAPMKLTLEENGEEGRRGRQGWWVEIRDGFWRSEELGRSRSGWGEVEVSTRERKREEKKEEKREKEAIRWIKQHRKGDPACSAAW
jgi:hypothetical protein